MINAVIFDLDGTLVDLPIDYERLFEEFKRIIQTDNVRPLVDVVSKVDGATRDALFKAWEKAELAILNKVTVKAKGLEIYKENSGKRRALVTLQGKNTVRAILQNFNLTFEVVVTREDTLFREDQLLKAIKRLEAEKRTILFVGNMEGDAKAASKVGCQFVRV